MAGIGVDRAAPSPRRLLILVTLTALVLMTLDARDAPGIDGVRRVAGVVFSPVRGVVSWVADPVVDGVRGAIHIDAVEAENERLRAELAEARGDLARFPDVEAELAALQSATGVGFATEIPRIVARVTDDRRTGFERLVELDVGTDDGIREGNPVVTGDGLVGRVEIARSGSSIVRVITDPRSGVGVSSRGGSVTAVAEGIGTGLPLTVEFLIDAEADPAVGQRFSTTGRDGSQFPADVPVGTIEIADGDPVLVPLAQLDDLGYVTVLDWLPEDPSVEPFGGELIDPEAVPAAEDGS